MFAEWLAEHPSIVISAAMTVGFCLVAAVIGIVLQPRVSE